MTIRIGNAPCSWGVEFANDPRNPSWRTVLKENAEAGYTGIELGPVGFMPEDPVELGEAALDQILELLGDDPHEGREPQVLERRHRGADHARDAVLA